MNRKTIFMFPALIALWYAAGFLNLPLTLIMLTVAIFYCFLYVICAGIILKIVTREMKKNRTRFHFILLTYIVLLSLLCFVINRHYMHDMSPSIRISTKILLLFYTAFIGWNCLKRSLKKITIFTTIAYVLLILLSPLASLNPVNINNKIDDAIATIGYLTWIPADKNADKVLVTKYDKQACYKGYNLYSSKSQCQAILMDMEGNIVHKWVLGDTPKVQIDVKMLPDGDLICCAAGNKLFRLDWNSKKIWELPIDVHHDMSIDENGNIYVLAREDAVDFFWGIPVPVILDYVAVVSADGLMKGRIEFASNANKYIKPEAIFAAYKKILNPRIIRFTLFRKLIGQRPMPATIELNTYHSNSIQIIERDVEGVCSKGDILLSIREADLIAILNPETEKFVWEWGNGIVQRQHHATLLENNNIILFDNGRRRKYSTVIEIEPLTRSIIWTYPANKDKNFFSKARGGCERLPNGNTLITESDKGHVIEVTPDGSIVWEFFSPLSEDDKYLREGIYRMMRIGDAQKEYVLENITP